MLRVEGPFSVLRLGEAALPPCWWWRALVFPARLLACDDELFCLFWEVQALLPLGVYRMQT